MPGDDKSEFFLEYKNYQVKADGHIKIPAQYNKSVHRYNGYNSCDT